MRRHSNNTLTLCQDSSYFSNSAKTVILCAPRGIAFLPNLRSALSLGTVPLYGVVVHIAQLSFSSCNAKLFDFKLLEFWSVNVIFQCEQSNTRRVCGLYEELYDSRWHYQRWGPNQVVIWLKHILFVDRNHHNWYVLLTADSGRQVGFLFWFCFHVYPLYFTNTTMFFNFRFSFFMILSDAEGFVNTCKSDHFCFLALFFLHFFSRLHQTLVSFQLLLGR